MNPAVATELTVTPTAARKKSSTAGAAATWAVVKYCDFSERMIAAAAVAARAEDDRTDAASSSSSNGSSSRKDSTTSSTVVSVRVEDASSSGLGLTRRVGVVLAAPALVCCAAERSAHVSSKAEAHGRVSAVSSVSSGTTDSSNDSCRKLSSDSSCSEATREHKVSCDSTGVQVRHFISDAMAATNNSTIISIGGGDDDDSHEDEDDDEDSIVDVASEEIEYDEVHNSVTANNNNFASGGSSSGASGGSSSNATGGSGRRPGIDLTSQGDMDSMPCCTARLDTYWK